MSPGLQIPEVKYTAFIYLGVPSLWLVLGLGLGSLSDFALFRLLFYWVLLAS
jgi:hypothetical protein